MSYLDCSLCGGTGHVYTDIGHSGRAARWDCSRCFGTGRIELLPTDAPEPTWKAGCGCPSGTYHKPECKFAYGRGPAMEVLDELKQGQRATDQEIEDDLRDQIANSGDC